MKYQVVLFLPSFESGGVERNAVYFANGMVKKGFDVHLLYCRNTEEWFPRLDPRVNKVVVPQWFRLPLVHERIVDAINMLVFGHVNIFKIIRKGRTAIVSFQSNVIAIALAIICRVPIAVRLSNHYVVAEKERSLLRTIAEIGKKYSYRFANVVIANSYELAADYQNLLRKEVITIPNPIDYKMISFLKEEDVDEEIFSRKQRPIVISVGRLVRQKNYDLLLRAMVNVVKILPCDLVIIGEGIERKRLEKKIIELGLVGFVHFLGYKENVYKYLRCSDLFVLSSNYEGMPNVIIEAIACGLPIVSTRCKTGPSEVLCDGKGGVLVPVDNCQALSKAIISSLTESTTTNKKYAVALANLHKYDINIIEEKYSNLLNNIFKMKS